MEKLIILIFILCSLFSCKKNKNIETNAVNHNSVKIIESNNVDLDSLSILFDDLNRYQKNYAFKYNLEKNFPKYRKRIENLNYNNNNKYYNGLSRLLELYSKSEKYTSKETDSINNKILNVIFSKKELSEIRELYKLKITIDSDKSDEENIKNLIKKYKEIDFYFQKQIYFRDSLMKKFWEICPQYYQLLNQVTGIKKQKNDSLKNELLNIKSSYIENGLFLKSIIQSKIDSLTPTYLKNISPIFEKIDNKHCIYNMSTEYYADKQIFNKSQISEKLIKSNYNLFDFQEDSKIINKKDSTKIYAYNTKEFLEIKTISFGYQPDECIGEYYVFPFENDKKDFLFSSTFKLDIEYNNYPEIDNIIKKEYPDICIDCPNGWENLKSFGKLKGYDNIYFLTTKNKEIDDTDTFIRAIYLVNEQNDIVELWSSEFDNFGCACL